MGRSVVRLPPLHGLRTVGCSCAARQTEDRTHGPGGLVCLCTRPASTILSFPRSAAWRRAAPGPTAHQRSARPSTPRLLAPSLPYAWPFHAYRAASAQAYLCHGDASFRRWLSRRDEVT